jgi:hypothetical protein
VKAFILRVVFLGIVPFDQQSAALGLRQHGSSETC